MAIDGPGNFERDDAMDNLSTVLYMIAKTIRHTFTLKSENSLYDSLGEGFIIGSIDIFCTLCEHYQAYPSTIEDLDEVVQWKNNYLATFDRTIHLYSQSPDYIEKRRAVIVETFDRLYTYVKYVLED